MKRNRRIKIIATLGPASASVENIERLVLAGADVFRINMSHSSHDDMRSYVSIIRELENKHGPISILADLQGPKLRISSFADGQVQLERGNRIVLDMNHSPGTADRVGLLHPEIYASAEVGHTLLVDDGKINLKIVETGSGRLVCEVIFGGVLSGRKGVNVPDAVLPMPALTTKDREDCDAAVAADVDWIALSFVQRPEDVRDVKAIVKDRAAVMAKIERRAAINDMVGILAEADGIMIARGDLGVELPLEEVPGLQKAALARVTRCGKAGRGGDADAGEHDLCTRANPRRSLGRGHGGVRGGGRDHAVRRVRHGQLSRRGSRHDGQNRT